MTYDDLEQPQEKLGVLRTISLFATCTDDELSRVAQRTRFVEYKKGELVYREGDRSDALYIVASGRLQVFTIADGQKHIYTVLHNGDTFGEVSLLTGEPHSATVEAVNDTLVLQLTKADFDDLINRIPSLVLSLSRLLSKRLRTKGQFVALREEATVVAIYGAAKGVGRTLFAVTLGAALRRETGHGVILVDFTTPPGQTNQLLGSARPNGRLSQGAGRFWGEESLAAQVLPHPLGFDFLYVASVADAMTEAEATVAPLVSWLAKRYRYVLMDLPAEVDATVLKALTQADLIYLISDGGRETLIRTSALIHQLRDAVGVRDSQLRCVVNTFGDLTARADLRRVARALGRPPNFVLPRVAFLGEVPSVETLDRLLGDQRSPYARTIRRIARELGGLLVGLALGSGAALGLAHIGVLKIIEREKIPIDLVAGSSVGALIAGLWASGRSADELEEMALRFRNPWDIRRLFILDLSLPVVTLIPGVLAGILMGWMAGLWAGLLFGVVLCLLLGLITGPLVGGPIQGTQLMAKLQADFQNRTFEDTWLPLKIVAANPIAREEVVFESGPLADAVRASVSIPGIFKPVIHRGGMCLDGGVVNPVPVETLKKAGAHTVIAVNVFPTGPELARHLAHVRHAKDEWDSQLASRPLPARLLARVRQEVERSFSPLVFDVIMRSMQSMEYQMAEVACRQANVTLRPTIPGSHWLEFYHPEKFIRRGEEEALRQLPVLRRVTGREDREHAVAHEPNPPSLTSPEAPGTIAP